MKKLLNVTLTASFAVALIFVGSTAYNITLMDAFNFTAMTSGTWFGSKVGPESWAIDQQCVRFDFKPATKSVNVQMGILIMELPYTNESNVITISNSIPFIGLSVTLQAWIVGTDYTGFAVAYLCGQIKFGTNELAYYSTPMTMLRIRNITTLSPGSVKKMNTVLTNGALHPSDISLSLGQCF